MQPSPSLTRGEPRATVYEMAYFPPEQYEAAWAQGLLDALADPSSPDHDDAVELLGEAFDPARHGGATAG